MKTINISCSLRSKERVHLESIEHVFIFRVTCYDQPVLIVHETGSQLVVFDFTAFSLCHVFQMKFCSSDSCNMKLQ